MKRLFVDIGAFVAKEIAEGQYQPLASRGWNEASKGDVQLVSSEHVFDESATLIARRTHYAWASEWGRDVLETEIEWLRAEPDEWCKALLMMRNSPIRRSPSRTACQRF